MAAGQPLSRLVLIASSVADDLGYVALADVTKAIEKDAPDHRIIGGHMISRAGSAMEARRRSVPRNR
jgi:hypothetical protein